MGKDEPGTRNWPNLILLRRQKLDLHITAGRLEVEVGRHENPVARLRREFQSKSVHVRNLSFQFDQGRANRPIRIRRNDFKSKRTEPREHQLHRIPAMSLACNPSNLAPVRRGNDRRAPSRQMGLDDLRHPHRARLVVEVAQDRARIEDVGHHRSLCLSFRRRSRFNSSESEGLPEKSPRVLSTSSSETGSRTIRDPSCVTAMRVPGLIPSDSRISEGITNCPFVLTEVICLIMLTLYHRVRPWDVGRSRQELAT